MNRVSTVRRALIATLVLALVALAADRLMSRSSEDAAWNPRVVQRQQLRYLSGYITDYARRHGRPAFHLDSEHNGWPEDARGRRNRLAQFTQAPVTNEPVIVSPAPVP